MGQNYYYLVAGLPDIILDDGKLSVTFDELMQEISEQVEASDRELLKVLRLPYDNKNLVSIIDKNDAAFDSRGYFSREELSDGVKNPETLPGFMQEYVEAANDGKELFPGLAKEDQLTWLFYDEVTRHNNSFIAEWFSFERDLRNVIAGINYRRQLEHIELLGSEREKPVNMIVLGRNEIAEAVLRSNAPDFGIGSSVPWVEQVIAASKGPLIDFEKAVDTLRWNVLNDLTCFSYFSIETILAFVVKMLMVERWKNLDPEAGKDRLDLLVKELCSGFTVPKGF
ncbi:MAG TPA: DUF2764 family protein [Chitinispirillaceae bacterium]|nr:DUF2764 family protein [Chitinispirillaceae bacterium]